ncbi:DUF3606 domain-containing protein [Verticiella sediminum]|uniref:DUF3606 domain-containing protein n=1 Tax=Verticiella sediminum TaxID=1247510 RepID=A0A556ALY4_9BURK|nr:DUF3606 domain-containing protein [Verticiella sediminum]
MGDDKNKTAHDRKLIDLNTPYEVRDWTQSLAFLKRSPGRCGKGAISFGLVRIRHRF